MPIESWIETGRKRVCALVSGTVTLEEMLETIDRAVAGFPAGERFDIFSDHTGLEKTIESEQARSVAQHIETLQRYFAGARWAVVTKRKSSYGMMRMLAVYLERVPLTLRVFYSHAEAEGWLVSARADEDKTSSASQ